MRSGTNLAAGSIALDLPRIRVFLDGYREVATISPLEVEAIPVLMEAKRACDALGSLSKARKPDADHDDRHKSRLEQARMMWLIEHGGALRATVEGPLRRPERGRRKPASAVA